ncbi:hypothetical protein M408DRAFT_22261 [Serendipita vermifera MAFF 305830]|uniref:DUF6533 domain-containing protein n=1 Tax=Serendipita vermifera MAFF 305830 TaxID=933852 RepID=A0A0C2WVQ9_SERVB|nr:hypothetical protein M408DRAFT_22261 [Serendipita vermifera MAFF 305830]
MDIDIKSIFEDLFVSRYVALTAITLCIYDWILVIDEEVIYLGAVKLSKGKVFYYTAKVFTLIGLFMGVFHLVNIRPPLNKMRRLYYPPTQQSQLRGLSLGFIDPTSTISLRQLLSKVVIVWLLYISLFASYLTSLGLLIHFLRLYSKTLIYLTMVHVCVPLERPVALQAVFEAPLAYEVVLFGLTVWRAWGDWRTQRNGPVRMRTAPLLKIMYRDGVFYFFVMVAVRVWNIYIYAARPIQEMFIGVYIMWSLITILSCRIYLNILREARRSHVSGISGHSVSTRSPHVPTLPGTQSQAGVYSYNSHYRQANHVVGSPRWAGDVHHQESYLMQDRSLRRPRHGEALDIR